MARHNLTSQYDSRKDFYGKATVEECADGTIKLFSYDTHVASIFVKGSEKTAEVYGWYSQTTGRHIKEFLKQHGFRARSKEQILEDYGKEW